MFDDEFIRLFRRSFLNVLACFVALAICISILVAGLSYIKVQFGVGAALLTLSVIGIILCCVVYAWTDAKEKMRRSQWGSH